MEEILTILVNTAHSLSPETQSMFKVAEQDLVYRLGSNYDPDSNELFVQDEDLPKVMNVFLDWKVSSQELFENIVEYFQNNSSLIKMPVLAEVAVIFASKVEATYADRFFKDFRSKFLDNLEYLEPSILYKTLWSLIKSG